MAKKASKKSVPKRRRRTPRGNSGESAPVDAAVPGSRKDWNIVGRQELAQLMGVHPDTVTDYARSDMPVITRGGRGKESEYNAIECLAWQRQQMGRNALENAKTKATELQAQLSEIKIAQQRGELVSRSEVEAAGRRFTAGWRAKVLGLPRALSQLGAIRREQEAAVSVGCRELLTDISGWSEDDWLAFGPPDATDDTDDDTLLLEES
jgi:hypothetical protein